MEYGLAELVLLFFIYACLGWCAEVAYAACRQGRFVNRGFLNGPICPIYGFGMLTVALLLGRFQRDLPMLFLGSFLLTTLLELVTGFVLEKLFHTRWWDYSRRPLNIGGYVCLLFSIMWGLACVVILKWVHAPIRALIERLPPMLIYIMDALFGVAFAADIAATLISIRHLSERLTRLSAIAGDMRKLSNEMGEGIAERTLAAKGRIEADYRRAEERRAELERRLKEMRERRDALLREHGFGHRRLLEAFPNMRHLRHGEAIDHLREALRARGERGAMKGYTMLWPEGRAKALTFSWDDGVTQDRRLLSLMRAAGLRGTFNINSGQLGQRDRLRHGGYDVDHSHIAPEELRELYAGQEVAVHTVTHPKLTKMSDAEVIAEISDDRAALERLSGGPVRGMAYPFGQGNARVQAIAASCGMRYARAVETTDNFSLPARRMDWKCTCHYRDMGAHIDAFLSGVQDGALFSVWGHSYELDAADDWAAFEEQLKRLGGREEVWYATNIEVFDYLDAFAALETTAGGAGLRNPSDQPVWLRVNGKAVCVAPGAEIQL